MGPARRAAGLLRELPQGADGGALCAGQQGVQAPRRGEGGAQLAPAALAKAAAAAPRRVVFTEAGRAFIDAHADAFVGAGLATRRLIVGQILAQAACHTAGREDLSSASASWTASTVHNRLMNRLKSAARALHQAAA